MKLQNLQDLFLNELKDLYSAEKQLVKALPKMAKAASSEELKNAFEKHLAQTEVHVERLESVFESMDKKPTAKTCKAMEGLIEEGKELISEDAEESTKDAGLICAAQKVEHYEIASYGCLVTFANHLGLDKGAKILQETLQEEKETDQLLTEIAESEINMQAEGQEGEEEKETVGSR